MSFKYLIKTFDGEYLIADEGSLAPYPSPNEKETSEIDTKASATKKLESLDITEDTVKQPEDLTENTSEGNPSPELEAAHKDQGVPGSLELYFDLCRQLAAVYDDSPFDLGKSLSTKVQTKSTGMDYDLMFLSMFTRSLPNTEEHNTYLDGWLQTKSASHKLLADPKLTFAGRIRKIMNISELAVEESIIKLEEQKGATIEALKVQNPDEYNEHDEWIQFMGIKERFEIADEILDFIRKLKAQLLERTPANYPYHRASRSEPIRDTPVEKDAMSEKKDLLQKAFQKLKKDGKSEKEGEEA